MCWVGTAVVIVMATSAGTLAKTYYVSPRGSDANDGLGPEPHRALRTIQAGVDKLGPGDTLLIRGGVYRETVVFKRSGTAERPITVRPYKDEEVVISGCDEITGWQRHEGAIWKAPMPWTLGPGRNQVFMDGKVMIEARFPNDPAPGLEMPVADLSPLWPTFGEFSIPQETRTSQPGRVVSKLLEGQPDDYWKGAIYYGVHYEGWCAQTGIIESSKSGEIIVGNRTQGWWFGPEYGANYPAEREEGRGMIVGHIHALDRPGEWVWQDGTLYFIPPGGRPGRVEAKRRQLAFDLSGCEHINIIGLRVTAASVRMEDSAYCTFERCHFTYISHFTHHFALGQVAQGRDTIKSGETGIYISGHDNAFISCSVRYSAGAGFHLRGYHHTIHNCLIDEVNYTAHYLNAITDAVADYANYENLLVGGHVITFNTMRNAGRHFFNFYGNGPSLASRTRSGMDYMATLFAHNHLYNGMLLTRDAGFVTGYFCSAGTLNGLNSQVAYNVMHDDFDIFAMRINALGPIYLDSGTCNVDVHHNLIWAAPGTLQRGIWFNTCCANCTDHDNIFHPEFTRTCAELRPEDFPGGQPFRFGHDFDNPPPVPNWPQITSKLFEAESCKAHSSRLERRQSGLAGLANGEWVNFGPVDFDEGWQSAVLRLATTAEGINVDKSNRQRPRHQKPTDPLVLEVVSRDDASPGIAERWTYIYGVKDGSWVRFNKVPLGEGYRRLRVVYGKVNDAPASVEVRLDSLDGPVVTTVPLRRTDRDRGGAVQIYGEATAEVSPDAQGTHDVFLVFRTSGDKPVGEFEYFRFERYR
ncbi:MAG: carbohydrate-binding protein, partial [Armatimonadetes bacterium]|nr:carbohydrate-binding protein [Armatimonadota bacterium]